MPHYRLQTVLKIGGKDYIDDPLLAARRRAAWGKLGGEGERPMASPRLIRGFF